MVGGRAGRRALVVAGQGGMRISRRDPMNRETGRQGWDRLGSRRWLACRVRRALNARSRSDRMEQGTGRRDWDAWGRERRVRLRVAAACGMRLSHIDRMKPRRGETSARAGASARAGRVALVGRTAPPRHTGSHACFHPSPRPPRPTRFDTGADHRQCLRLPSDPPVNGRGREIRFGMPRQRVMPP